MAEMGNQVTATNRTYLFLQGPHGPFFHQLATMLGAAGATVWRVGFNRGDQVFWPSRHSYIPFTGPADQWPETLRDILTGTSTTDLVLYGDTRTLHAQAVEIARAAGLRIHVFEEGYLRPYWITYERGGTNGHSRLMAMNVKQMRTALDGLDLELPEAPPRWGDMRQHIFYGMLYHAFVFVKGRRYRHFSPHRDLSVRAEFKLYLKRLMLMPFIAALRLGATRRIIRGGFPYHLCLLQLEHDASFQAHSPFTSLSEFLDITISGFAQGAPEHHHLVIKDHPLEDGRAPVRRAIRDLARAAGVGARVHYVRGGKLARLLNTARSAVTVNSTAAQQVLWRGLPLKVFGAAVYDKPEFVSTQSLPAFFAQPDRPDSRAYRDYRHYLLETSQIPGGFYAARGRRQVLRQVVDMMLATDDPYDALEAGTATPRQQLHLIG